MKIKTGDKVIVIAGKYKGVEAKVTKTFIKTNRVILEKVNMVKKHLKPSQTNPDGGIKRFEASLHVSNVALSSKSKVKPKKNLLKKLSKTQTTKINSKLSKNIKQPKIKKPKKLSFKK